MSGRSCWTCFASGVVLATAVAAGLGYAWSEYARVTTMSNVHAPLLAALTRMRQWAESGDQAQLTQYLEQLESCWEAYASGHGATPESFIPRLNQSATPCPTPADGNGT